MYTLEQQKKKYKPMRTCRTIVPAASISDFSFFFPLPTKSQGLEGTSGDCLDQPPAKA